MMSVTIVVCAGETRDQYIRRKFANHAHDISQRDIMSALFLKSLFGGFGVSKIGDAAEALLNAVVSVGSQ